MAGYREITKETALEHIRRYRDQYPDSPPEIAAMHLMRAVDDWSEHTAILKALDEVLAEVTQGA